MWLDMITVIPFLGNDLINSLKSPMPIGSNPLVGSSKINSFGLFNKAIAIPSLC